MNGRLLFGPARRAAVLAGATLMRTNVSVAASLDPYTATSQAGFSLLLVGTDRRRGGEPTSSTTTATGDPGRADAIVLIACDPASGRLDAISLARGIGVDTPAVGYQRLGWALEYGGASAIVTAARRLLDISIHHYVRIDFQGFAAVVDALDGVSIDLDHAARDRRTGVDLEAGQRQLDGREALAFVRSRHHDIDRDGELRTISLGDTARRNRLRLVVEALAARARLGIGPIALARLAVAAGRHIVADGRLVERLRTEPGLASMLVQAAAWQLRVADLPTRPVRPAAALRSPFPPHQVCGADYLEVDPAPAQSMLQPIRATVGRPSSP